MSALTEHTATSRTVVKTDNILVLTWIAVALIIAVTLASFFVLPLPMAYLIIVVIAGGTLSIHLNTRFVLFFALLPLSRTGFGILAEHPGFGIFDLYALWFVFLFFVYYATTGFRSTQFAYPIHMALLVLVTFLPGLVNATSFDLSARYAVVLLVNIAMYFGLYLYLHRFSKSFLLRLLNINIVISALISMYGLYLSASASSIFRTLMARNSNELTGDPNHYACYLLMVLSHTIGMLIIMRNKATKFLYGGIALLLVVAVILTISRAGYITLVFVFVMFGYYVYQNLGFKRILLAVTLIIVLGTGVSLMTTNIGSKFVNLMALSDRLESAMTGEDGSVNQRTKILTVAWRIIQDSPVLGVGYGNFESVFNRYREGHLTTGDSRVAHNTFITILAENGIIGFTGAMFLFGSMFIFLIHRYRIATDMDDKPILFALITSLGSFMVMSLTLELFNEAYFWAFAAFALAFAHVTTLHKSPSTNVSRIDS